MRQVVQVQSDGTFKLGLNFFRHHTENVSYTWNNCTPEVGTLYTPELEKLLCPTRKKDEPVTQLHKDLARSAQAMYEEAFFALLNALHQKYRCDHLALSGGCAMNSVANGKVYLKTPFQKMYLPAAAGDAGGAIGAAFVVHYELAAHNGCDCGHLHDAHVSSSPHSPLRLDRGAGQGEVSNSRSNGRFIMTHAYTGPQFSDAEIEALLRSRGLLDRSVLKCGDSSPLSSVGDLSPAGPEQVPASESAAKSAHSKVLRPTDLPPPYQVTCYANAVELCGRTARAISEGQVIGWFQGRMEWGPRALGNRSILGDPRRADMKEILNTRIKRRESFRPFAPSILREHVSEWFEQDDDVPFMMQVFQVRSAKRSLLPAVCHVDGSGRLQTVSQDANPLYHQLISAFCSLTSVPPLLNTSFNENEPVVCRPEEALDCFLRTKMDVLVLGNYFVMRKR
jgi:carbamoyltransferase